MTTQLTGPVVMNDAEFGRPTDATFVDDISVPLSNSYPAGGYTGLQALLRAQTGDQRQIMEILTSVDLSGYVCAWDAANGALRLFTSNGASANALLEVPTSTDLHLTTLRIRVLSK